MKPGLEKKLKVYVIGIGTSGGDFLTEHAEKCFSDCDVIIGWQDALNATRDFTKSKNVFQQDVTNYQKVMTQARANAVSNNSNIALLLLGDPLYYPAGVKHFYNQFPGFDIKIIPSVGIIQLAAAAAGVTLEASCPIMFQPQDNGSIDLDALHRKQRKMIEEFKDGYNLIIQSDLEQTLSQCAGFLIENGLPDSTSVVVCEEPGEIGEKIHKSSLCQIANMETHWKSAMVVLAQ